jgi:hypothetical protein
VVDRFAPVTPAKKARFRSSLPIDPQDVAATIYWHLGIDARNVTFYDHLDRPLPLLNCGEPIRELIG